jgi:PST family polysaccharide transporter
VTPGRHRTGRALAWTLLDVAGSQGLSFLLYVVLTRLVVPAEYGIFAIALAITAAANIVLAQGLGEALIQREAPDEDDRSTAFWFNLLLGATLTAALLLAAPLLARAFGEPLLGPVLMAMAPLCLLRALVSVHAALCRREMRMAVFALRAIGGYVVGGGVGILLAMRGHGVWALVACQIVQALVILAVMWVTIRWRPRLRLAPAALRRMGGFGGRVAVASLLAAAADKVDVLIIGLVLDAASVAYYALALKVLQAIGLVTMAPLNLLLMPVLARLAADRAAFREEYVRLVTACLAAWLPAVAWLGVLAPVLVPAAFGERWATAAPVLQAMSLGCATVPLWALTGQALGALGRPGAWLRLAALQLGLAALGYLAAAPFGIEAVGFAWAGVSALLVPIHLATLRRETGERFGALLGNALGLAGAGLGMVLAMAIAEGLGGPWAAALIGPLVYLALLEFVLLPGYVTGSLRFARSAILAAGATP